MGAAGLCQCLGAQPQAAWRQRLDRRYVQCVDRIHRQIARQQLFGAQQRLQGGITFAQALQQRLASRAVGTCLRAAHGVGQRHRAHFRVLGGTVQQFLGTLPLAVLIGLQAVDQAHPALFAAVAAPGAERCGDQAPQQP